MLRRHMSTSPPFKKIMAANRGEIATRILRAGNELGCKTVSDAFGIRYKIKVLQIFLSAFISTLNDASLLLIVWLLNTKTCR
jgi:hypothetical protein